MLSNNTISEDGIAEQLHILRTVSRCRLNSRDASLMLMPSIMQALRTRRYISTLYIHHTFHGVGLSPMEDGGRSSFQPPSAAIEPPDRYIITPPFTASVYPTVWSLLLMYWNGLTGCYLFAQ